MNLKNMLIERNHILYDLYEIKRVTIKTKSALVVDWGRSRKKQAWTVNLNKGSDCDEGVLKLIYDDGCTTW